MKKQSAISPRENLLFLKESDESAYNKMLKSFDGITQLAAFVCNASVAYILLADENGKKIIACQGDIKGSYFEEEIFSEYCLNHNSFFCVGDADNDSRFADSKIMEGREPFIFFAGMPVTDIDGNVLGVLVVADGQEKLLGEQQVNLLKVLAEQAVTFLTAVKNNIVLQEKFDAVIKVNELLEQTNKVAHRIMGT